MLWHTALHLNETYKIKAAVSQLLTKCNIPVHSLSILKSESHSNLVGAGGLLATFGD